MFDGEVYAVYSDNSKVKLASNEYSVSGTVDLTTADTYPLTVSATIDGVTFTKTISINVVSDDVDHVVYTLTPVSTDGNTSPHNNYSAEATVTISGIEWSVMGNSNMVPWRIGGKSITDEDRVIYSKTALDKNISKIVITHGGASSITVNSMTVIVASDADFSTVVSTLTPTFKANDTVTVERPAGADWSECFYKIIYNVTVSGSNNRYLEFTEAEFTGK